MTDHTLAGEFSAGCVVCGRIDSVTADADEVSVGNAVAGNVGQVIRQQLLPRTAGRR